MMNSWRPLALAAALNVTLGAGMAAAQTLIVRHAPPGAPIELFANADRVATAPAGADGTVTLTIPSASSKTEMDGTVFVDACEKVRRVFIVERGQAPGQQEPGCERREIPGLFWIQRISTLVVDVGGPSPSLRLRQGSAPGAWLTDDVEAVRALTRPPTGFVLFGAAGLGSISNHEAIACGTVVDCSSDTSGGTYTGGITYWFSPFLGAEAGYLRPPVVTTNGEDPGLRFNSELDMDVITFNGKVGIPAGRVRIYGQGGANYNRGVFTTTQTIDDVTIVVDGIERVVEGGTQTIAFETRGWGWQFGGGMEAWVNRSFAITAEGGRIAIKGSAVDEGEGSNDVGLLYAVVGARIRFGR